MTDKEKFRKEVEKLKSNLIYGACSSQVAMETRCKEEAYDEVLAILDTMQKEPVSTRDKLMALSDGKQHLGWLDDAREVEEESVSEELEEAAKRYGTEGDEISGLYIIDEEVEAFKAGANWQEKQDKETIELAEDHAMLAGMEKMKEQMMAKAIDGYVIEDIEEGNGDFLLSAEYLPKSMGLKDRQKVKVVVVKGE